MQTTLQLLLNKYNAVTLNTEQLAEVLHMEPKSLLNSISAGRCPIPTFKAGRKRLANTIDVARYLDEPYESKTH